MKTNSIAQHLAAAIGFVAILWPSLCWYVERLGDGGDERLGAVVLVLAMIFAWIGRRRLRVAKQGRVAGVVLAVVYVLAIGKVPNLIAASIGVFAVASYWGLWRMSGVVGLLWLSLPLVASLQFYLGYPLRLMTATGAEVAIGMFGIEIERAGVQLVTHGGTVGVDPACSGVKMLWSGGVYTMLIAAVFRLAWLKTFSLGVAAFVLILSANVLRSALLVLPEAGVFVISGTAHEMIGVACWAGAAVVIGKLASTRSVGVVRVRKGGAA